MRINIIGLGVILFATCSTAQELSLNKCKSFDDDDLRLVCYDQLSGYEKPEAISAGSDGEASPSGAGWIFEEYTDEFSGKDTSYVYLSSDAEGETMSDKPKYLVVQCDGKGGRNIYVETHGYIGGDRVRVRYKFGDNGPISERWLISTDGTSAFLPKGYKDFLKGILSNEDFIFEVTDYNGSRALAHFKGASSGVERRDFVLNGCKK